MFVVLGSWTLENNLVRAQSRKRHHQTYRLGLKMLIFRAHQKKHIIHCQQPEEGAGEVVIPSALRNTGHADHNNAHRQANMDITVETHGTILVPVQDGSQSWAASPAAPLPSNEDGVP